MQIQTKISIIIPCLNEAQSLAPLLKKLIDSYP